MVSVLRVFFVYGGNNGLLLNSRLFGTHAVTVQSLVRCTRISFCGGASGLLQFPKAVFQIFPSPPWIIEIVALFIADCTIIGAISGSNSLPYADAEEIALFIVLHNFFFRSRELIHLTRGKTLQLRNFLNLHIASTIIIGMFAVSVLFPC